MSSPPIIFDPRWSLPNGDQFIRQYLQRRNIEIDEFWDAMGEMAVLAVTSKDDKVRFGALKELMNKTKITPRSQDALSQPVGGIKPLHVGLAEDVLIDGEWQEIEEEADAEFSEYRDDDGEK